MSPLEILGLSPGCSLEEAKTRWRQLVLQHHPDHASVEDTQRFQEIQAAYEAIKTNPSLLDGKQAPVTSVLRVDVEVSIEDFYLAKNISIQISRLIFCKQCNGTGSETRESGLCAHCGGTGQIKSNVLKLMNRDATCPVCQGVGVPPQNLCTKCEGQRYEADNSLRKIQLTLPDYHKKTIFLKGAGHQLNRNTFGNVFVKLQVKPDDHVFIEDLYFKMSCKILPVQRIIGDICEITVFGRKLKFRVDKNATETLIEDRVAPGISRQIRILFVETPPVLTEDTLELYKKIIAIERETSL